MSRPLLEQLAALAHATPDRIALRDDRRALAWGDLPGEVAALTKWLRELDCRVVALQLPNGIEWVLLDLACQAAGLICLPLPEFFSTAQIQYCVDVARVDLLITVTPRASAPVLPVPLPGALSAQRLPPTHAGRGCPPATCKITFTSGSTGAPKGVCLDETLPWRVADSLARAIALPGVRHLCLLPLATLLENIAGVYAPLLSGGEVLLPGADARGLSGSSGLNPPALLACIERSQPHSLILLPQLLSVLVAACERGWRPPASLRFVAVGGARVAPQLLQQARGHGLPVYEGYGLSECGSVVALNTPAHDRPGCVGRVLDHCRVAIDDDEIVVSGASHLGYLGEPASWSPTTIRTGDLGALDGDGFLRVGGRRKHLLITSFGRNVSPEWIESELTAQPLLNQCVVFGDDRPHLVALLGAPDAVADVAVAQWVTRVNAGLPDYARVRAWHRLPAAAWPPLLTANGRPRRAHIAQAFAAEIDALYTHTAVDLSLPETHHEFL